MNTGDLLVVDYGCPLWLAGSHCGFLKKFLKKGDIVMVVDTGIMYYTVVSCFGLGTLSYIEKMSAL